jgi:hypothetical protein
MHLLILIFLEFTVVVIANNSTRRFLQDKPCPGHPGLSQCNSDPFSCCPVGLPCCGSDSLCYKNVCGNMCSSQPCDCNIMPSMCDFGKVCCPESGMCTSGTCPTPVPEPTCCELQCNGTANVCAGQCFGGIEQCVCCSANGSKPANNQILLMIIGGGAVGLGLSISACIACCYFIFRKQQIKPREVQLVEIWPVHNPLRNV